MKAEVDLPIRNVPGVLSTGADLETSRWWFYETDSIVYSCTVTASVNIIWVLSRHRVPKVASFDCYLQHSMNSTNIRKNSGKETNYSAAGS